MVPSCPAPPLALRHRSFVAPEEFQHRRLQLSALRCPQSVEVPQVSWDDVGTVLRACCHAVPRTRVFFVRAPCFAATRAKPLPVPDHTRQVLPHARAKLPPVSEKKSYVSTKAH